MSKITNKYTQYLYKLVSDFRDYSVLLGILHEIDFYWTVPNDGNRAEDGLDLRRKFVDSGGNPSFCRGLGECTVLEMLLALSDRLVFETVDSEWEKTQSEWFFILLDNLGLERMYDHAIKRGNNIIKITDIVHKMLARQYDYYGVGGLFPIANPRKDQRKVEIWYQMSAYIMENYF